MFHLFHCFRLSLGGWHLLTQQMNLFRQFSNRWIYQFLVQTVYYSSAQWRVSGHFVEPVFQPSGVECIVSCDVKALHSPVNHVPPIDQTKQTSILTRITLAQEKAAFV